MTYQAPPKVTESANQSLLILSFWGTTTSTARQAHALQQQVHVLRSPLNLGTQNEGALSRRELP